MDTNSAFWRDLEAKFRALPDPAGRLIAMLSDGQWHVYDGPNDERERERLQELFRSMARRAAIAAGVPTRANALDGWLNLLREESPHFRVRHGTHEENGVEIHEVGGYVQGLALASAEYCMERATRAFELESAAADDSTPTGLRRDRYPFCHWLYDHAREPLADPKAELEYWKGYVWQGYHDLLENYARMQMARADRYQKLNFAIAGLSYDLAVLQANYAIDRDLRGEEAMRAFQDEGADLLKEVTAAWRTSGERLDLSFEDDPEAVKDFAQPFHRVRDDLRRLLHDLPPTPPTQPGASTESREPEHAREAFVLPILNRKGWSLLDWANTSEVDFHTVNDYLKGATKPYPSTRVKLAASLGVAVEDLPK
jgi:hypothetical protein